jgi:hypothetical protein
MHAHGRFLLAIYTKRNSASLHEGSWTLHVS